MFYSRSYIENGTIFKFCAVALSLFCIFASESFDEFSNTVDDVTDNIPKWEWEALNDIYFATNGINWKWQSNMNGIHWNFTGIHNPCLEDWQAINCDCTSAPYCHIETLWLDTFNLTGYIPHSISNLTMLKSLNLANNFITGGITDNIGDLKYLTRLFLDNNKLHGTLPLSLGNLKALTQFQATKNKLVGTLPVEYSQMSSLQIFLLSGNNFTGTIPSQYGQLTDMQIMKFDLNSLHGSIPETFTALTQLIDFRLHYNYFEGHLLPLLCTSWSLIQTLSLTGNAFSGPLSAEIGSMTQLEWLFLDNNFFTGTLPESLQQLTAATMIYLGHNLFEGPLPIGQTLAVNQTLEIFALGGNSFTGSIPDTWCSLSELEAIAIPDNEITGTLPSCLSQCSHMQTIATYDNHMTGFIPTEYSAFGRLSTLATYHNHMTGQLPNFYESRLMQVVMHNNMFSGPLSGLVTADDALMEIDLSNNKFTGTVPSELFGSNLQSMTLASNCLTGSIPDRVCDSSLRFLNMDGTHSAPVCQHRFFPHSAIFDAYTVKTPFLGGLPTCLFNMPDLTTLHVSGNNMRYRFPSSFSLSGSLQNLSLSHNVLTGQIPDVILQRTWQKLDLSYNKLCGDLSPSMVPTNGSLSLEVNRLSGKVPDSMRNVESISVLDGNMFDCNMARDALPVHDPQYNTYQCGSNSFNVAFTAWSICLGCALLICGLIRYYYSSSNAIGIMIYVREQIQIYRDRMAFFAQDGDLEGFGTFLREFRILFGSFTISIVLVFPPAYSILSSAFYTHSYEYAWYVSIAYLRGTVAGCTLLALLVCLVAMVHYEFRAKHMSIERPAADVGERQQSRDSIHEEATPSVMSTNTLIKTLCLSCVLFVNCSLMLLINGLYVWVVLQCGPLAVTMMQIAVAVFKLLWGDFAVHYLLEIARRCYSSTTDVTTELSASDMTTLTFIALFNSILAPWLANSVVDPSCFRNVFISPDHVSSTYNFHIYFISDVSNIDTVYENTVSYSPPFTYSYQCSSTFVTNYAELFVYMYLIVTFVNPFVRLTWVRYRERGTRGERDSGTGASKTVMSLSQLNGPLTDFDYRTIFHRDRFVSRTVSKITVFLTLGVAFPPLAVVIFGALCADTFVTQITIGRGLLTVPDEDSRSSHAISIQKECDNIAQLFYSNLQCILIPFASLFYSFFLFDTFGDDKGWQKALGLLVSMIVFPYLLWIFDVCVANGQRLLQRRSDRMYRGDDEGSNALLGNM